MPKQLDDSMRFVIFALVANMGSEYGYVNTGIAYEVG
jgi:hypothetical protein